MLAHPCLVKMPCPNPVTLADRAAIVRGLRGIVGDDVIDDPAELAAYASDGLTAYSQLPLAVVLPRTTADVAAVLRFCHDGQIKVVPRGSGTSLSGG
ncbi:MAG: FAD-binding oxidoreductase, partial [Sphingomonadaceae bacterium]|nr:FAD-binding oxidoreductase [Sphingomonadaceae bacterium]